MSQDPKPVSVSAVSRILSGEGVKKALPKGWSTGFYLTEFYGYVEVGYQSTDQDEAKKQLEGIAHALNQRPNYTAELVHKDDEFHKGWYVDVKKAVETVPPRTAQQALAELRLALDSLRETFFHTRLNPCDLRLQVLYLVPFKEKVRVVNITFDEVAQEFCNQRSTESFHTVDATVAHLHADLVH